MPDLPRIVAAVRASGDAALAMWPGSGAALKSWHKAPGQIVCDADLAVDASLRAALGAIDPEAGWLSEESVDDPARIACERVWIVDPIDGTRDFVRGRAGWCVSVALAEQGRIVAAILYAPVSGDIWIAEPGKGAQRNGRALKVAPTVELAAARTPAHALPHDDRAFTAVTQPNSIALRLAMVAQGTADFVATQRWGAEWDIAAAALIAEEAGATVTDALGAPLRFNQPTPRALGIVAATPAIHAGIVAHFAPRARLAAAD